MSREIDALIAEHVMGLTVVKLEDIGPDPVYRIPNENGYPVISVLNYSTDIAAAWEVIEKMDDHVFKISNWGAGYRVEVYFNTQEYDDYRGLGYHAEIAMAICLAALKAKGKTVEALDK